MGSKSGGGVRGHGRLNLRNSGGQRWNIREYHHKIDGEYVEEVMMVVEV